MSKCDCGVEMEDVHAILKHECEYTKAEQDWWSKYFKSVTNIPVSRPVDKSNEPTL